MTQEQIILAWLKTQNWVREYEIRCKPTQFGFIGARGDRTVRDMIKKGTLEASFDGKYRIVRSKPTIALPPARKPEKVEPKGMF